MKERFIAKRFSPESQATLGLCLEIIDDYTAQNLRLTLRQLYYQLVTRNAIRNLEREYERLSRLVSEARLAGLMNWDAIEDRVRQPWAPSEFTGLADLTETALRAYRLPRWRGQTTYVELWVEKDALAGVLRPLAFEFHVTLMVNRGYSSQSAMYEASKRFIDSGLPGVLLYLGDLDPSGEDMVRDIQARLDLFRAEVKVVKLALTIAQVQAYNPPPNPAKLSDPRAQGYIARYGRESWEVDALPPNVLAGLIRAAFQELINERLMTRIKRQEEQDKLRLRQAVENLDA